MSHASPQKRPKLSSLASTVATTAATVVTSEQYILANIVRFIPVSDSSQVISRPETALQTIVALCKAIPAMGKHVSPTNEHFWRSMVLSHFAFEQDVTKTFNVKDFGSSGECLEYMQYEIVGPNGSADGRPRKYNPDGEDVWDDHPVKPLVDAWNAAHPNLSGPEHMLNHDLHYWSTLRAYYRPSEFQFITNIQAGKVNLEHAWPDNEDAFTLFRDLVLLQKLVQPETRPFKTYSDGDELVYPLLMSRFNGRIHGNSYEMLEFCDLPPHYWCSNRRVSARWTGFGGPLPEVEYTPHPRRNSRRHNDVPMDDDEEEDHLGIIDQYRTEEEDDLFPLGYAKPFQQLRRLVYESCVDWRRVDVNFGESHSPIFHIGESKRSGRWLGYVGKRQYEPFGTFLEYELPGVNVPSDDDTE